MRADRLAKIREKNGYSQVDLSDALGLGQNQIWRYENGKSEPDGEVIAKIARFLNVSADYLLGLSDYPSPTIDGDLTKNEQRIINALRHGDRMEAIHIISSGE